MGIGCRNVAFIAICMLITFDILSLSAVPRSRELDEAEADRRDQSLPIHRQKRSVAGQHGANSGLNPNHVHKYSLNNQEKSYHKETVSNWDHISVNGKGNSCDDFYLIESPPGTRIKIKWGEKFRIDDSRNDYIVGYSGYPNSGGGSSKQKNTERLLHEVGDLPMLFTSRPVLQNQETSDMAKKEFIADGNELTLRFHHGSQHGPHDGHFDWTASYLDFEDQGGRRADDSTDALSETLEAESFYISEYCNIEQPTPITANEGTITSHEGFADGKKIETRVAQTCTVRLKSKNNQPFNIIIDKLDIVQDSSINNKCDSKEAHISIIDVEVEGSQPTSLCHEESEKTFEFSNYIEIKFFTGSWTTRGFILKYLAAAAAGHLKDNTSNPGKKSTVQSLKPPKNTAPAKIEPVQDPNEQGLIPKGDIDDPFDCDDLFCDDEELIRDEKLQPNPEPVIVAPPTRLTGDNKFSEMMMKGSMVAVGLILLVVFISAGFIACHQTKDQDRIIKDLEDKLAKYEVTISRNSIRNFASGSSNEVIPIISHTNTSRNSLEPGKYNLPMTDDGDQHHLGHNVHQCNINLVHSDEIEHAHEKMRLTSPNSNEASSSDEIVPVRQISLPRMENSCYKGESSSSSTSK